MDEDFCMRRRRVPAFGSWDFNDTEYLSYTQCFETARPGKLLRNSFSEHRDPYNANHEVFPPSHRIRRRPCSSCECIMSTEPQVIKNEKWLFSEAISYNNKNSEMKVNSRSRLRPMTVITVSETNAIDEDLYHFSGTPPGTHHQKDEGMGYLFKLHPSQVLPLSPVNRTSIF